ncbi:MAG: hypothetical protein ACYDGM_14595 [Vulcanimicrobiaceae bacterium]
MIRWIALVALVALAFAPSVPGAAQVPAAAMVRAVPTPQPTPAPDPHVYDDPAMHFVAPAHYQLVTRVASVALSDLSNDPVVVAVWVLREKGKPQRELTLSMESYTSAVNTFESSFESQIRQKVDGLLVRDKQAITLKNGMPAYFVDTTFGSGFTTAKQYDVVWADGQRGVILALAGRLGEVNAREAKAALLDVSATLYPTNEP